MNAADLNSIVAIDGGGTRCRMAFAGNGKRVSVEVGSANVSTDFSRAVAELQTGIQLLSKELSIPFEALANCPAFVGLAGMTGPRVAQAVANSLPFDQVRVLDDRPASVRGALGAGDGAVAHCGTGSFFGVQIDGNLHLAGGWGPVLGDQASAQWIGRQALRHALDAVDGLGLHSDLTKKFLNDFDGAAGIVAFAGQAGPSGLGQIAKDVTSFAKGGDTVARSVMRLGADYIAQSLPKAGWHSG
ncbi:MAG: BadF/BadG/BcrA/BcrD ATPase family protein [Ruegeria sp.]